MRHVLLLAVPVLLISGCSVLGPRTSEPAALVAARARWAAAGPDAYTMTQTRVCFCPPEYSGPFAVVVRDGAVASVTREGETLPADRALTVEALFDLVASATARGAARVEAEYDPVLGYPTRLYIDYDEQMADEEVGYTVANVRPD